MQKPQVVSDRASTKEYLRLLGAVLALVSGNDAAELAKVKPFAVEAVQVRLISVILLVIIIVIAWQHYACVDGLLLHAQSVFKHGK